MQYQILSIFCSEVKQKHYFDKEKGTTTKNLSLKQNICISKSISKSVRGVGKKKEERQGSCVLGMYAKSLKLTCIGTKFYYLS